MARRHSGQVFRFSLIGVVNTAVDFAVFATGVMLGFAPLAANVVAFAVANAGSYVMNARLTFRRDGEPSPFLWRGYALFAAAHLMSLAISTAALMLFADMIGPLLAKASSMVLTFAINYASSAFVVFRAPKKR